MAGFDHEFRRRGIHVKKDSINFESQRTLKMAGKTVLNGRAEAPTLFRLPDSPDLEQIIKANNALVDFLHVRFLANVVNLENPEYPEISELPQLDFPPEGTPPKDTDTGPATNRPAEEETRTPSGNESADKPDSGQEKEKKDSDKPSVGEDKTPIGEPTMKPIISQSRRK